MPAPPPALPEVSPPAEPGRLGADPTPTGAPPPGIPPGSTGSGPPVLGKDGAGPPTGIGAPPLSGVGAACTGSVIGALSQGGSEVPPSMSLGGSRSSRTSRRRRHRRRADGDCPIPWKSGRSGSEGVHRRSQSCSKARAMAGSLHMQNNRRRQLSEPTRALEAKQQKNVNLGKSGKRGGQWGGDPAGAGTGRVSTAGQGGPAALPSTSFFSAVILPCARVSCATSSRSASPTSRTWTWRTITGWASFWRLPLLDMLRCGRS